MIEHWVWVGQGEHMGEGEPVVGDDFKYSTGLTTAGGFQFSVFFGHGLRVPIVRWSGISSKTPCG